MARTATPVVMEMSRRFMGRLSLTRGAGQKRASQVLRRRGTVTVSGMASTLTSAWWLQASHVAVTAAPVLKRHRRAGFATHGRAARLVEDEVQGDQEGALHGEDGDAGDDGEEPPIRRHLHDGRMLNRPPVVWDFLIVQMPDPRYVGRMPLTLRPGDGLCLGLECLEEAIPLFLDDIVHDSGPFPPAFGAGLNEDCRHDFSPRVGGDRGEHCTKPKAPIAANDLPAGSAPRLARLLARFLSMPKSSSAGFSSTRVAEALRRVGHFGRNEKRR
jgi:hypothetical protein